MSVYISVDLQRQVRSHFAGRCAYCQTPEELTVVIFEIEHIIPRSADGQTTFHNLCLACPTCNRYKSNRQTAPDLLTGAEVALFHPHNQIWRHHFAWSAEATELIGLTATGRATIELLQINRPQMLRIRSMWLALGEHPPDSLTG